MVLLYQTSRTQKNTRDLGKRITETVNRQQDEVLLENEMSVERPFLQRLLSIIRAMHFHKSNWCLFIIQMTTYFLKKIHH